MSVVEGLPFAEEKKKYIVEILDPVLEEMVTKSIADMPADPRSYMIDWLRARSGACSTEVMSKRALNAKLRRELKAITASIEEAGTIVKTEDVVPDGRESDEDEDDDDELDELPEMLLRAPANLGKARQSVSAEAYGMFNKKKQYTAPVHPKTPEQKQRIKNVLLHSFMFNGLDPQDLETILMAVEEASFVAGEQIITEGGDGDDLFVVESGSVDCVKLIDGEPKVVKTCVQGDVFGELALLYNTPRAASVLAKGPCVCWRLDRESFNHIVKDAAVKRRNKYDSFLQSVALISSIGAYERSQIADVLVPETFTKGTAVVRQDEPGDKFYIVEEGLLFASKNEEKVMDYSAGDYFGELALLKNQPRAASVIVDSDVAKVLSMKRTTFNKMLGPLQEILAKRAGGYK